MTATIRKHRWDSWRGYLNGVKVAEFGNTPQQTAEESAKKWLEGQQRKATPQPRSSEAVVEIDCSGVAKYGYMTHPVFVKFYWDIQKDFSDHEFGRRVCVHEAAHALLMEADCIQNVRFLGPAIWFNQESKQFEGRGAMVLGDDMPPGTEITADLILNVSTHAAAGGVWLADVEGVVDAQGEERDYNDFLIRCGTTPPHLRTESPEQLWKRAKAAALKRLTEPRMKEKVPVRAEQYLAQLYGR